MDDDLAEMKIEYEQQLTEANWTLAQVFKSQSLRLPMLLLCSMACCQQLSGINAVLIYNLWLNPSQILFLKTENVKFGTLSIGTMSQFQK